MKRGKLNKELLKVACISACVFFGITFSNNSFAIEFDANLSDEYKEWIKLSNEEKMETMMPQTISGEVPTDILEKYELFNDVPNLVSALLANNNGKLENISANISDSKYNLKEKLNLRVENQKSTTECWAFSSLKAMETNVAIKNNISELPDFSERHMDYATTKTFTDGTNPMGYNRELGRGGLPLIAYSYLINGTGAVLESDMPFKDNENKTCLSEIQKNVDTVVTDYITLPTINKEYTKDSSGNTISVKYFDKNGKEISKEDLDSARNIIKEQLVLNGAISSITAANHEEYYNTSNPYKASAYNCNSGTEKRDHAITIVGWDDNYSKDNFKDGHKPSSDGAYLILNSYGTENFDNGYMYVSYEDFFIESEIYGVQSTNKVDYDNIYQDDFYGSVFQIGTNAVSTGYYGISYERNTEEKENLNSVGVTLSSYSKIEIYVNPNGTSMSSSNLIKVGESSDVLSPGYHRINITPIELTSKEFAIVIKQISNDGKFSFAIETKVEGTAFENVTSENNSYYSINSNIWQRLSDISVDGIDTKNADVCIKAFTTKENDVEEPGDGEEEKPNPGEPDDGEEEKPNPGEPDDGEEEKPNPGEPDDGEEEKPNPGEPGDGEEEKPNPGEPDDGEEEKPNPGEPGDGEEEKPNPGEPDDGEEEKPNPGEPDNGENNIKIEKYKLIDNYIKDITFETKKSDFEKNIKTNLEKTILSEDGKEVVKDSDLIKTGMKLKLSDGTEYILIVRGDINKDGKVTLTDISKLLLHYNGNKGFTLTDTNVLEACDMNFDNKITITDVSQIIVLYNSI